MGIFVCELEKNLLYTRNFDEIKPWKFQKIMQSVH
jgi:hypothetical protein